jgi:hypothetical protein
LRCRRHLVAAALGLAKHLDPLALRDVPPEHELFEWWRREATEDVPVRVPDGRAVAVALPRAVPLALRLGCARMLENLCSRFAGLALAIGRDTHGTAAFVRSLAIEMNDGLVGLLVNGLVRGRCPHAREIATAVVDSRHPARARLAKELQVRGDPFRDALGRFFAAPSSTVRLPRTGARVVLWRASTCPFADYAYAPATSDPGSPAYCPQTLLRR